MKPRRFHPCLAATPAGVVSVTLGFRGCRFAQPPANGWHPFGMAVGKHEGTNFSGTRHSEPDEPGAMNSVRMHHSEPGGFKAISRWLLTRQWDRTLWIMRSLGGRQGVSEG